MAFSSHADGLEAHPLLQYVKPNLQLPNQSNQSSQDHGTEYAANHGPGNAAASDAQLSLFAANSKRPG